MELKLLSAIVLSTLLLDFAFGGKRIFGGDPIEIEEAPYMAHIFQSDKYKENVYAGCGGAILRPNLILTAAHCVMDLERLETLPTHRFHVISGSRKGCPFPKDGVLHKVKTVFPHPKFQGFANNSYAHHDIAILELVDDIDVEDNPKSKLIDLAHEDDRPAVGTECKLAGWGTNPEHDADKDLYQIHYNVVSTEKCREAYNFDTAEGLEKHEICAHAPGKNQCEGDSGGPMIDTTTNRQVGIVSYNNADCTSQSPGVLTRVTDNLDFINEIIEETSE